MLTVIRREGLILVSGKERNTWFCRCECGGDRVVSSATLLRAEDLCCGCIRRLPGQEITLDWLFNRCIPEPNSGCWLWMGAMSAGYGHIRDGRKLYTVHALSFTLAGGILPAGWEPDHLCRVPLCINPAHLEGVPHSLNVLRGGRSALKTAKTHCPQGHPYDGENRYENGGKVFCRQCNRDAQLRYRGKKGMML